MAVQSLALACITIPSSRPSSGITGTSKGVTRRSFALYIVINRSLCEQSTT